MKMGPCEYTQGCSDGGCCLRIGPRPGQVTNGGCRCLRDVPTDLRIKIMRKFAHERQRLAAAEAFVAKHKCGKCGGVRVTEQELCKCTEAAKGGRDE